MGRITPKRSYILLGKQRLSFSDWLYFLLNGAIFVSRIDKNVNGAAIAALRDVLATMRWKFMERKGIFSRAEMDIDAERRTLHYSIEEYPPIDWKYQSTCIYHPHTEPKDAFTHLDRLIPYRENAVLFQKG